MRESTISNQYITECTWDDVSHDVRKIDAVLAKLINKLSPDKKYPLYKVRYPYGSYIIRKSSLQLPNNKGTMLPLKNHHFSSQIQSRLGYNLGSNPVSLVLNNTMEIFLSLHDRTIPLSYGLFSQGALFGTWLPLSNFDTLHPAFIWDITSGSRSVFMLPKISDTRSHQRLKKHFKIDASKPNTLIDHWPVFKEIANSNNHNEKWHAEILFFSNAWFKHFNDKLWHDIRYYILDKAWQGSDFFRNQFIWNLIFSMMQEQLNIKPNAYTLNTVKHLLAIGLGKMSGFAPAENNLAAPINLLQKAYHDIYQLKSYDPIIMQPKIIDENKPVYYSLNFPTAMEFALKADLDASTVTSLSMIQKLLDKCLHYLLQQDLNIISTPFSQLPEKISYDFFHAYPENHSNIFHSKKIADSDSRFTSTHKEFPATSNFLQGCIRISNK